MKEGWTYKKLGEVCDFEGGSQPPKSEWINHPEDGYVRMLQIRDFTKSRNAEIEYVKVTKKLRLCKADDILIGRYGASVGKILTGLEGAYNVAIIKSIPNEDEIRKDFIRRYFESPLFQSLLFKVCTSRAAQAGFSKDDIKDELVPIPPLSEQQRIVKRLDSAFAHIDELKANAEKQLNEARALFQKALSKAMEPQKGWEEKTLKEIGITQTGTTPSKNEASNYGDYIPFIRPSEIDFDGSGNIEYNSEIKLSEKGLSNGRLFKKESILMVCIGATIGKVGFCTQDVSCNQQINVLTPKEEYDFKFLYYAMRNQAFQAKVIKDGTSAQATLPIINKGKWEKLSIFIPPLSEQQRIVERLDSLSTNVKALEENQQKVIAECDALKQALLRKVFE